MTSDYVLSLFYWVLCTALVFIPYLYIYNILSCGKNNIPLHGTTNESDEGKLTRPEYYPEDSTDVPSELPKPLRQICIVALLRALAKEQLIDANLISTKENTKPIFIGNHVWICNKCDILKGSVIGDHCVVGYSSLCTKEIPGEYQLIAGRPAKVIQKAIDWQI